MSEVIQVGGIPVLIIRAPQRKTIGLTVERDGTISARAPTNLSADSLHTLLKKRELWMHASLAKRNGGNYESGEKSFVTGEGFCYLGRHYRLRVVSADGSDPLRPPLRLLQSRFVLISTATPKAKAHFVQWYTCAGKRWLTKNLHRLQNRVGVSPSSASVRDLGFRWGSCSKQGRLNFHWRTFMLPARSIEYLVLHELCHLLVHNHSPAFWREVGRVFQHYETQERWLASQGIQFSL